MLKNYIFQHNFKYFIVLMSNHQVIKQNIRAYESCMRTWMWDTSHTGPTTQKKFKILVTNCRYEGQFDSSPPQKLRRHYATHLPTTPWPSWASHMSLSSLHRRLYLMFLPRAPISLFPSASWTNSNSKPCQTTPFPAPLPPHLPPHPPPTCRTTPFPRTPLLPRPPLHASPISGTISGSLCSFPTPRSSVSPRPSPRFFSRVNSTPTRPGAPRPTQSSTTARWSGSSATPATAPPDASAMPPTLPILRRRMWNSLNRPVLVSFL